MPSCAAAAEVIVDAASPAATKRTAERFVEKADGDVKLAPSCLRARAGRGPRPIRARCSGNLRAIFAAAHRRSSMHASGLKPIGAMAGGDRRTCRPCGRDRRVAGRGRWPSSRRAGRDLARPRIRASFVICGRGSSGHAGVFLRYLFEIRARPAGLGLRPVGRHALPPGPRMSAGALFIVISQSGRSPDLVAATARARKSGALTLALVNDAASPVAHAAEEVLPIEAGPERSVAATKTVVISMVAGAQLVARWTADPALEQRCGICRTGSSARSAATGAPGATSLTGAPAAFVTARGYGLGPAKEIALKLTETMRLPAPRLLARPSSGTARRGRHVARRPCSRCAQDEAASDRIDALVRDLRRGRRRPSSRPAASGGRPALDRRRPSGLRSDRHAAARLSRHRAGSAAPGP